MSKQPQYDIIIPVYGQHELTRECLKSIEKHSSSYRVIIIDNTGDNSLRRWGTTLPHISYTMPYNTGFTAAINIGLSISNAPYIVIMNTDTTVETPDWLERLSSAMTLRTAAIGPATDRVTQWQGKPHPFGNVHPHPINHSFGFDTKLTFFCTMIRREAFLSVGYLDPNLPHGLGADDDWLWRAHLKGWELMFHPDVMVKHVGAASFNLEQRGVWQKEAVAYLKRKYSLDYYVEKA